MRAFEVRLHASGIDEHGFDENGGFVEQIIGEGGGVGDDDAFGGRVRNIAFVPEGDVFESSLSIGAHDACESGDLLAGDGIALVGHGGRSLLLFAEKFFGLTNFGALEVADFGGNFVERRGDGGERRQVKRVAIALNDLRGDGGGIESEAGTHFFFELGREVGEGSDCSGKFTDTEIFGGGLKADDVALCFGIPVGDFESESDGFGVDAVGSADHGSVFELPSAAFEDFGETEKISGDERRSLLNEEGLRGIDDVVRGQSVVKPAGVRADDFGDGSGEGDDIVFDFGFDLEDAIDIDIGAGTMALAASFGTIPAAARVSVAATSTASQVRKRFSSLQMRAISGRV